MRNIAFINLVNTVKDTDVVISQIIIINIIIHDHDNSIRFSFFILAVIVYCNRMRSMVGHRVNN